MCNVSTIKGEKTWKPIAAGIAQILTGALDLLGASLFCLIISMSDILSSKSMWPPIWLVLIILLVAIWGILAIIGGVYALKRKRWRLALAGSIVSFLNPWTWELGIAAIVLTALSKKEFE